MAGKYYSVKKTLHDTEAFSHSVISNIPAGIVTSSYKEDVLFVNRAAEQILGLSEKQIIGKGLDNIFPDQLFQINKEIEKQGLVLDREIEISIQGKKRYISVSAAKILNEDGMYVGKAFILKDQTDMKALEDQVKTKEKLAAIGELAAGIAHEIRNPLSSIKGLARFFYEKFSDRSEEKEAAEVMVHEVERLNRTVSELLEFARPTDLRIRRCSVNELVTHCLKLVQEDLKAKDIRLDYTLENKLEAELDPDKMAQCLLNLLVNGIESMSKGGRLTVRLNKDDTYIKIHLKDSGKGIPKKDLRKIFDPYFTTKPSGTGLGLAIVYKIIEAHNGKVEVFSEVGKGTEFIITLPAFRKNVRE